MDKQLLGSSVAITISDPWEFGTECGVGPFVGIIEEISEMKMLIKLKSPIMYQGVSLCSVVASPRYHKKNIEEVKDMKQMNINIVLSTIKKLDEYREDSNQTFISAIGSTKIL